MENKELPKLKVGDWMIAKEDFFVQGENFKEKQIFTIGKKYQIISIDPLAVSFIDDDGYSRPFSSKNNYSSVHHWFKCASDEDEPQDVKCERCGRVTGPNSESGCDQANHSNCAWHVPKKSEAQHIEYALNPTNDSDQSKINLRLDPEKGVRIKWHGCGESVSNYIKADQTGVAKLERMILALEMSKTHILKLIKNKPQ